MQLALYIYAYMCPHFVQMVAAVVQACCTCELALYCANTRGLPIGSYFVHYQGISSVTKMEAFERESKGDSKAEQLPNARCTDEQLVGEGCAHLLRQMPIVYLPNSCGGRGRYSRACCVAAEPSHVPLLRLLIAHLHFCRLVHISLRIISA